MGVYDTIKVPCPKCGELYYAQSKSGRCELEIYDFENTPHEAMIDVNRHAPFECDCGAIFEVQWKAVSTLCEQRERVDDLGIDSLPKKDHD